MSSNGTPSRRPGGARPRPLRYGRSASTSTMGSSIDGQGPVSLEDHPQDRDLPSRSMTMEPISEDSTPRPFDPERFGDTSTRPPLVQQHTGHDSISSFASSSAFFSPRHGSGPFFTASPDRGSPQSFSPIMSPRALQSTVGSSTSTRHPTSDSVSSSSTLPPSQGRWDQIRSAVRAAQPPPTVASPPPLASSAASISSFSTSSHPTSPPVSAAKTPKSSRFRAVVDSAATQQVLDASARFEADLRRACWETRYGSTLFPMPAYDGRSDRDAYATPLATGTSTAFNIPMTASSSTFNEPYLKSGLKRPPSLHSVVATPSAPQSVNILYQTLLAHAPLTTASSGPSNIRLPLEAEIMSVLLSPLLSGDRGKRMEDERRVALDAFELITKTWRSPSFEVCLQQSHTHPIQKWILVCRSSSNGGFGAPRSSAAAHLTFADGSSASLTFFCFPVRLRFLCDPQLRCKR